EVGARGQARFIAKDLERGSPEPRTGQILQSPLDRRRDLFIVPTVGDEGLIPHGPILAAVSMRTYPRNGPRNAASRTWRAKRARHPTLGTAEAWSTRTSQQKRTYRERRSSRQNRMSRSLPSAG